MQALIDFDGWRKWKDAAEQNGLKDASSLDRSTGSFRKGNRSQGANGTAAGGGVRSVRRIPEGKETPGEEDGESTPRPKRDGAGPGAGGDGAA
jgi:hypothetical protein